METNFREATVKVTLVPMNLQENEVGYQVYDSSYPYPLPSEESRGLFGQLFGVIFKHEKPTVNDLGYSFRAISHHEYISCFGYDSNFNFQILYK